MQRNKLTREFPARHGGRARVTVSAYLDSAGLHHCWELQYKAPRKRKWAEIDLRLNDVRVKSREVERRIILSTFVGTHYLQTMRIALWWQLYPGLVEEFAPPDPHPPLVVPNIDYRQLERQRLKLMEIDPASLPRAQSLALEGVLNMLAYWSDYCRDKGEVPN